MSNKKFATLSFTVALALGGVVALLWLLGGSRVVLAQSGTGIIRVATTGSDTPGCGSQATPCQMVQYAVDQAQAGEEIRVAAGTYTGVQGRPAPGGYPDPPASGVITQVVYISKTVTIRGGYTTAFTDPPDPEANQTTLDAQGEGRVVFVTGDISPTIEGLRITGGDAAGMGGVGGGDAGGGIYVNIATTVLSGNLVYSNTAYGGGGLWLLSSDATLSGNTVISNTADHAGGLCLYASDATLSGNTVISNSATGYAGGLYLDHGAAMLSGNTIIANTAGDHGGGLYLYYSGAAVTLSGNTIISNTTEQGGGGLYLDHGAATLSGNTIISNTAYRYGGGLYLWHSDATLSSNTVMSNTADGGGGLYLLYSDATLSANTISDNIANGTSWWNGGGGLFLELSAATLTNNVVADNQTGRVGSGLYIWASSPRLLHTTIARNSGGDGSGVYVTNSGSNYSTVALTNTILVSHTVGITVTAGNTAMLESTLWHGNITDWGGAGTIITGTHNYWGDPLFDADGYHLTDGSEAIDKGVDAGVTTDIDGDSRDSAPDLGADERAGTGIYLPIIMKNASP